jgi:hypothetical protein
MEWVISPSPDVQESLYHVINLLERRQFFFA